jgi:hypothetical protein
MRGRFYPVRGGAFVVADVDDWRAAGREAGDEVEGNPGERFVIKYPVRWPCGEPWAMLSSLTTGVKGEGRRGRETPF